MYTESLLFSGRDSERGFAREDRQMMMNKKVVGHQGKQEGDAYKQRLVVTAIRAVNKGCHPGLPMAKEKASDLMGDNVWEGERVLGN